MKTFKQFVSETCNFPVVSISKLKVGLTNDETIDELNKNLSISLSVGFDSVYQAFEKARKILSMYGIELPAPESEPNWSAKSGTIKVDFGNKNISGENHNGSFELTFLPDEKCTFKFDFVRENGIYSVTAEVSRS